MKNPKVIAGIVVLLLFGIVLLQNGESVEVEVLFWRMSTPKVLLIPLLILSGFVLGFVVARLTGKGPEPPPSPPPAPLTDPPL